MLVNGFLDAPGIYSTICDDYTATYDAATRLIRSGHRDILYLYTSQSYSGINKMNGYKNALRACGLSTGTNTFSIVIRMSMRRRI